MLKGMCINPEIVKNIAFCGHGDKILIADGNYPLESKTICENRVYLGLTPGLPKVTQVLESVSSLINIEKVEVMEPSDGTIPEIFKEFTQLTGEVEMVKLDRFGFYDACCKEDVKLCISSGEMRTFANILITVGVTTLLNET